MELLPISRKELQPLCKQFLSVVVGLREATAKRALSPCRTGELGPLGAVHLLLASWRLFFWAGITWNHKGFHPHLKSTQWRIPPEEGTATALGSLQRTVTGETSRSHLPRWHTEPQVDVAESRKWRHWLHLGLRSVPGHGGHRSILRVSI